ncbi:hypothetical protein [Aeromonas simiae]|uniref:hypothetical protein n=1 Tax=Aeromonas simiae TaxID=218936 RepID=UPI0005A65EEE|nr:hypothetical protein [Aeromonas simiae]MDO2949459.1 hypothetical protein [Aeromonas simiae]MDO2953081.1 hypothetical protein [Aeromonas simiae]MDO2956731.1 hypothetical protein [Aeromonas simiae]
MEISGSVSASYGQEAMVASLAKKQQEQQGQAALALLQSAAQSAPAPQPSSSGTLGSHINIKV